MFAATCFGSIGSKHVEANIEILQLYILTFYVFNKRVHLLVESISIHVKVTNETDGFGGLTVSMLASGTQV